MIRIEHTVDVATSAANAYSQWTQYETYPLFMENVKEVSETTSDRLHWHGQRYNGEAEWESEITAKVPQRMLAWRDLFEGSTDSTTISIHEVDNTQCRVQVLVHVDLHVPAQSVAAAELAMIERVHADLARFKALMEHPEALPFDSGSPGITGIEYSHHVDAPGNGLLTNTPGSPIVPTPKDMSRSPDADGKDNRIDLETSGVKNSNVQEN